MSENRFADCLTVRAVLRTFRNLQLIDADDQDDAEARIRELTPPTVSEEARERAQEVLDKGVRNLPISGRNVYLRGLLVRIIAALGYTPAPGENCYKCGDHQYGVEPVCKRCQMVMLTDTPVSPPVVELDAATVRKFIDHAQTLIVGLEGRVTMVRGNHELSLYSNGIDLVLRIGGTDE